jgi:iron complex transport system permease protein
MIKEKELNSEIEKYLSGSKDKKKWFIIIFLLIMLVSSMAIALAVGAYSIKLADVYRILLARLSPFGNTNNVDSVIYTIVWEIRLPRILLSVTVGIALSLSGGVYQGCFRNPLVEPFILGVSSGAAFGAALAIVLPAFILPVQAAAFIFGTIAVFTTYLLAKVRGETPLVTLILAGVIIGSIFSALVSIMKYIAADSMLREIMFWLMGGFYYASWKDVVNIAPVVTVCFFVLWYLSWKLNILSMGDEEARTLGVNPERYKVVFIVLATLITAVSVATVGIIAWVGLMMPHAARMLLGPDHRFMLPAAGIMGGIYMVFCDTLARTITTSEIPVGIITSIIGAPYLVYLLRSRGKHVFHG